MSVMGMVLLSGPAVIGRLRMRWFELNLVYATTLYGKPVEVKLTSVNI